jgi:3-oxoadipate CoA-transferase beta subunit
MTDQGFKPLTRPQMAQRVASDIVDGWVVNLGIGVPTAVADCMSEDSNVMFHSENGLLGMGPAPVEVDPFLINAGKKPVTIRKGGAFFHHADSFAMIRGGHIDLCVLGAYEVAENGDLANWITNSDAAPAVGGAMDLSVGAKRLWVMMEHNTRDGAPRLVEKCSYELTAVGVVTRIYTNLAVVDVENGAFVVREMVPGLTRDELQKRSAAPLAFS